MSPRRGWSGRAGAAEVARPCPPSSSSPSRHASGDGDDRRGELGAIPIDARSSCVRSSTSTYPADLRAHMGGVEHTVRNGRHVSGPQRSAGLGLSRRG
jgi:hypothetical protein